MKSVGDGDISGIVPMPLVSALESSEKKSVEASAIATINQRSRGSDATCNESRSAIGEFASSSMVLMSCLALNKSSR